MNSGLQLALKGPWEEAVGRIWDSSLLNVATAF
jgi:hypothetical protein